MSWPSIILVSVFSANVFLVYGLGSCDVLRKSVYGGWQGFIAHGISSIMAALLLWFFRNFILAPLGLKHLDILVFALVIVPLVKYLAQLGSSPSSTKPESILSLMDDTTLGCLVFGIALLAVRKDFGLPEVLLASAFSVAGYSASVLLLASIGKRLALSSVPRALKGSPILLLSAGLMAMAFSGIDTHLIARLIK